MIGMMYLVLTALLALNISKEVLNGFVKVENSLQATQHTLQGKVQETKGELETKFIQNQEKVRPFKQQADAISAQAEDLIKLFCASMPNDNHAFACVFSAAFPR